MCIASTFFVAEMKIPVTLNGKEYTESVFRELMVKQGQAFSQYFVVVFTVYLWCGKEIQQNFFVRKFIVKMQKKG
jgi:hypothetical protein